MLTREQLAEFEERGVLRLPGGVDRAVAESLCARIRAYLAERRLVPESSWRGFAVTPSKLAPLTKKLAFQEVWGPRIAAVIDDILGAGAWGAAADAGQFLASAQPVSEEWLLPHQGWHLDYMAPTALRGLPGVQLFLCLDRVESHGGATVGVAGSHRLIDALRRSRAADWEGRSADVRKSLARDVPWVRALFSARPGEDRIARFMAEPTIDGGVPLQVVEFTGEPGDVIVMHPWLFHAATWNCGARARIALTLRIRANAC